MRFGAFYKMLMKTGERGIKLVRMGERGIKHGKNGRTWEKRANVAQTGERGTKRGKNGRTWLKRANVEMGKTTFDHLMSGMRFLMQTKCFMLETYVLNLCA